MRDSGRDHHPAGCEVSREALQQESSPRIATCRKPLTEESSCEAGYKTAAVFCVASLLSETWQAGGVHIKDHDPSADISRKLDNSTQLKGRLTLSLSQPSRSFPRKPKERPSAGRARGPTPPQRARNNLGIRRRIISEQGDGIIPESGAACLGICNWPSARRRRCAPLHRHAASAMPEWLPRVNAEPT